MAFVHRQSREGVKTELDLFTVPPTQNCISDSHVVEHQPTASLDSGGPIPHPRIGRRLLGSRQHDATRAGEGVASQRTRSRRGRTRGTGEQLAAFAVQPGRRLPEWHARGLFVQHVRVSILHRDAAELRIRRQVDAADESAVVQGQG